MSVFKLHCYENSIKKAIYYNNETNTLSNIKKDISSKENIIYDIPPKQVYNTSTFKITLGFKCNYSCKYCYQRIVTKEDTSKSLLDIESFVNQIPETKVNHRMFEFWGGEPLLYWDVLYPLAKAIRKRFPDSIFYMPTNGSLLDLDKNRHLVELGFNIGISHDGPGQAYRGKDILSNFKQQEIIQNLFNLMYDHYTFTFDPTISKYNCSRKVINEWFRKEVGHSNFRLGNGKIIHPSHSSHVDFCFNSQEEHIFYRRQWLKELLLEEVPNFFRISRRLNGFIEAIRLKKNWNDIREDCGNDREDALAVDLEGNLLTCHSLSVCDSINTYPTSFGNLADLKNIESLPKRGWRQDIKCQECPILHLCAGGCIMTPKELKEISCDNYFSDYIPIFALAIKMITGLSLYYIEGPQEGKDRKDVFGMLGNSEKDYTSIITN